MDNKTIVNRKFTKPVLKETITYGSSGRPLDIKSNGAWTFKDDITVDDYEFMETENTHKKLIGGPSMVNFRDASDYSYVIRGVIPHKECDHILDELDKKDERGL